MSTLVDARKGVHDKCVELFHNEKVAESIYRYLCDGIEECDGVELEQKKGEWIDTRGDSWVCSNCGVECYVDEDYRPKDKRAMLMHYCHYCGAKMGSDT